MPDGTNMPAGPARVCGSCTACCKTREIYEDPVLETFLKPPGVWCKHCDKGRGCQLWNRAERPRSCLSFCCSWLEGDFSSDERPDRTKIVAEMQEGTLAGTVLLLWELVPQALKSSFADNLKRKVLAAGHPVLLLPCEGVRVLVVPSNVKGHVARDKILDLGIKVEDHQIIDTTFVRDLTMGIRPRWVV
ncbi:MAG: hypothetical protein QG621_127 [Patescibacteria group bacterium]|nr:hypothetical protein [Patescibacteria group bacterium]